MVAYQQQQDAGGNLGLASLTLSAGATVGDLVIAIGANNFYTPTNLSSPTGTAVGGGWTLQHTLDGGSNDHHAKVWTGTVSNAAGTIVEGAVANDEERYFGYWLVPAATYGSAASTDNDAASTSHVAPTVSPTTGKTDDLLICLFGNNALCNYTAVTNSMTFHTERDVSTVCTWRAASQTLSADVATGTRTATSSASGTYMTVSVLAETTGGAAPAPSPPWPRLSDRPVKRARFR